MAAALCLLALHGTLLMVVTKCVIAGGGRSYSPAVMVVAVEAVKLLLSLLLEYASFRRPLHGRPAKGGAHTRQRARPSFGGHLWEQSRGALAVALPAALYAVQNNLAYVALERLPLLAFQVLSQTKILTTAVCAQLFLGRPIARLQWLAMGALFLGIVVVQFGDGLFGRLADGNGESSVLGSEQRAAPKGGTLQTAVGLGALGVMSCTSALAGVLLEGSLKRRPAGSQQAAAPSMWMHSVNLAGVSLVISSALAMLSFSNRSAALQWLIAVAGGGAASSSHGDRPLQGLVQRVIAATRWPTRSAVLQASQVVLQACGGMLVSVVIRYTDNVCKSLAAVASIILNGLVAHLFFDEPVSASFLGGTFIATCAMVLFAHGEAGRPSVHPVQPLAEAACDPSPLCRRKVKGDAPRERASRIRKQADAL